MVAAAGTPVGGTAAVGAPVGGTAAAGTPVGGTVADDKGKRSRPSSGTPGSSGKRIRTGGGGPGGSGGGGGGGGGSGGGDQEKQLLKDARAAVSLYGTVMASAATLTSTIQKDVKWSWALDDKHFGFLQTDRRRCTTIPHPPL